RLRGVTTMSPYQGGMLASYIASGLLDAAGAILLAFPMITDMKKFAQCLKNALKLTRRFQNFKEITPWLFGVPILLLEMIACFYVASKLPDPSEIKDHLGNGTIIKPDIPYLIPLMIAMIGVPCVLLIIYFLILISIKYLRYHSIMVRRKDDTARQMH